ncbi:unnamed protein product [Auanema sp. JU1783]|nr:unnamed protein product [Auanema sp. JU1783]
MFSSSPETFLVILAIFMCSILFIFTITVVVIFHCCRIKDIQNLPNAVVQRTRMSYHWARNSVFSLRRGSECPEDEEDENFLSPRRAQRAPSNCTTTGSSLCKQNSFDGRSPSAV